MAPVQNHKGGVMKAYLAPVGICLTILYFSYHALSGDQGLAQWAQLQQDEDELKAQLAALVDERDELASVTQRLRAESLDLDYVEELARTELSFTQPGEILVAIR